MKPSKINNDVTISSDNHHNLLNSFKLIFFNLNFFFTTEPKR